MILPLIFPRWVLLVNMGTHTQSILVQSYAHSSVTLLAPTRVAIEPSFAGQVEERLGRAAVDRDPKPILLVRTVQSAKCLLG